ncbi:MAG: sigma-70 family RNA polymerase sigma factor [Planctomycetota bacterium]|nr:sigma-70 family RNA polymerase sigma factor [Planctomycetota bacterium]
MAAVKVETKRRIQSVAKCSKESTAFSETKKPQLDKSQVSKLKAQKPDSAVPAKAKSFGPRSLKTFRNPKLEASFIAYAQLLFPEEIIEPLSIRTKRILATEIDLIGNEGFDDPSAQSEIMGTTLFGSGLQEVTKVRAARLTGLPAHLARLCETRLLTPEEERILFRRMNYLRHLATKRKQALTVENANDWSLKRIDALVRASDWYRDLIVKSNMRLVISIVKKFVNPNNVFDDLLSDGIVGLMRAIDKFDYDRGFRFSTYATQVVRRNAYRIVMQKQKERLKVTTSIQESGIDVSDAKTESSISIQRWDELRGKLGIMLDHLDRREKFIVRARFSLGGHRNVQTLQRLADKLGVSKERVRQLEKRALDKLRGMVSEAALPEIDS